MTKLWRIAQEGASYSSDDLSGSGAKATGGRWNSKGNAVLYTSSNIALCVLESIVHFNAGSLPQNRFLIEIDVPEDIWNLRQIFNPIANVGWDALPAGITSVKFGDNWINSGSSLLLCVPSIIVAEEMNVLINPNHPDLNRIACRKIRKWHFDPRVL